MPSSGEFASRLNELLSSVDLQSTSSTKWRPVEIWLKDAFGFEPAVVKWVTSGRVSHVFGEPGKRDPKFLLLLTSLEVVPRVTEEARKNVARGGVLEAVGIVAQAQNDSWRFEKIVSTSASNVASLSAAFPGSELLETGTIAHDLVRFDTYSRKEVHDVLSPSTPFTPQSGTWGLQGIVPFGESKNWVFFVTWGQSQAGHDFQEAITESGVFEWQSQPKQKLEHQQIRDFIGHKHTENSILLMLRTSGANKYIFLGHLAYLDHDDSRENPVHFRWQILDWLPDREVLEIAGVHLVPDSSPGDARYWAIGAGAGAGFIEEFLQNNEVRLGYSGRGVGDITGLTKAQVASQATTSSSSRNSNDVKALYEFATEMQPGDRVLVKRGTDTILAYGSIVSDYHYDEDADDYAHFRQVEWHWTGNWILPSDIKRLPRKTLTDVTDRKELIGPFIRYVDTVNRGTAAEVREFSTSDAVRDLFMPREAFERIVNGLRSKKNVVLQGAPGVGKTFVARLVAYTLLGCTDNSRLGVVQFHQNMSYEDFVQGWRPSADGGNLVRRDGLFHQFASRAQSDPDRPYVFIIDEINRGNLSKILGELMMLIEPDKRGQVNEIPLTYSNGPNETFYVPKNLYILGLMNTADRSLAIVDYALRRRFRFFELEPQFDSDTFRRTLLRHGVPDEASREICNRMRALNDKIENDTANLGRGYRIGHSFFCPSEYISDVNTWYREIVLGEIYPLLEEYWFDDRDEAEKQVKELLKDL